MMDAGKLAESWIQLHLLPKDSKDREALDWSCEKLNEMCESSPESGWDVILKIIALNQSDSILANLGAGPFEDLMGNHGATFIDRVESCARENPPFRRMLGVVWKNSIPDSVWIRLRVIAPPSW